MSIPTVGRGGQDMERNGFVPLLAAAALLLPASVQGQFLDDFNDGDALGWTTFTVPEDLPGATWDASNGDYRLSVMDSAPAGGVMGSYLDMAHHRDFRNGTWKARVVRETENSTNHLWLRGDFGSKDAWAFGWYPDVGLCVQRIENGVSVWRVNNDTFVQDVGVEYFLEAKANWNDLQLRMWAVGDDRPGLPQIAVGSGAYPQGAFGIVAQAYSDGDLSVTFDDVSFIPGPATSVLFVLGSVLITRRRRS